MITYQEKIENLLDRVKRGLAFDLSRIAAGISTFLIAKGC